MFYNSGIVTKQTEQKDGQLTTRQALRNWFNQPLGRNLLEMEKQMVNQALSNMFGYHIVQLGCLSAEGYLGNSRISHKVVTQLEEDSENNCNAAYISAADALSLASDSIDVMVLPHTLEFTANPHKLLREVERVLIGEGHLVLIAFNPWSFWGCWRLLLAWRDNPPWNGHFYRLFRIKDWLTLLDFEVVQTKSFFFRPPLRRVSFMQKFIFLEKLGKFCWPIFGGVHMIIAKKRLVPLTPVKMRWRARRNSIASGIAEPSARSYDAQP